MTKSKKALVGDRTPARATETAACSGAAISDFYFTTPPKARQVSAYLPVGAGNAISGRTLATLLGFKDVRQLSKAVERERRRGVPICAAVSGDSRGYFLASSPDELSAYLKALDHRLREVRRTRDACGDTLRRLTGQECIEGW